MGRGGERLRILMSPRLITLELNGESFTTTLQSFLEALEELRKGLADELLIAADVLDGAGEPVVRKKTKAVSATRVAKNQAQGGGLKVYIPKRVSKWLGISHGSRVRIECIKIGGERAAAILPCREG